MLDPILVTSAARDARPLLDTPVSASVLEGEVLAVKQATNFQELIGDAPGLTIEGGPRAFAQEPNIRGFQNDQIVVRIDGARFNFDQAHRGRFFLDPDLVQRVEIIRGGGSTLYGSGALGGVISMETRSVDDLLEPGDDVRRALPRRLFVERRDRSGERDALRPAGQFRRPGLHRLAADGRRSQGRRRQRHPRRRNST